METINWISKNYIEIFGALAGVVYVFLEIRQNIWLWPVGIVTSAAYLWVFFTGRLYAEMSLQVYYLVVSIIGWYWWGKRINRKRIKEKPQAVSLSPGSLSGDKESDGRDMEGAIWEAGSGESRETDVECKRIGNPKAKKLEVSRITAGLAVVLAIFLLVIYAGIWFVLDRFTDSPVPGWDSFITSFSIIGTLMLARKIYEHWYLWIIANCAASILFFSRGLYPTMVLYMIYMIMSFAGLRAWRSSMDT